MKIKVYSDNNFKKAYTLIEMLVVIAIIAILASIAVPVTFTLLNKSKKTSGQVTLSTIGADTSTFLREFDKEKLNSTSTKPGKSRNQERIEYVKSKLENIYRDDHFIVTYNIGVNSTTELPPQLIKNNFPNISDAKYNKLSQESFYLIHLNTNGNSISVAKYTKLKKSNAVGSTFQMHYPFKSEL